MDRALLVIDIQNDYFPGGNCELEGSMDAAQNARKLIESFRKRGSHVIYIQHLSLRPGATYLLPETLGAAIHEAVFPHTGEIVFQKNYPNSFRNTGLLEFLSERQLRQLYICGMMTHMCVDSTTRAAFDLGFSCTIAHDACATKALTINDKKIPAEHVHLSFLAALNGMFARVQGTDEIISTL
ncbi:MAG TPA: cysteine hydrolase family protein [Ignavibacteriales bacterium]|nr:cysteine hydrolase family protein [Ignavibacteriales bacterium]